MKEKTDNFDYRVILTILVILGCVLSFFYSFRCTTKSDYDFDSYYVINETAKKSTEPIKLPEYFQNKGVYEIINDTGYTICVHTKENGFRELGQGKHIIDGGGAVFWIAKPDSESMIEHESELQIKKSGGHIKAVYSFNGNDKAISSCTYSINI